MPQRFKRFVPGASALPRMSLNVGSALRAVLREGITKERMRGDVLAGIIVGVVALPLSMALAIASGVPPQHGLYTAIIAGALIAATGGSRVQVSGPTAAFVVILVPIAHQYGLGGLCIATMLAGAMLLAMGALGFGQLLQYVPHPVTTGFTSGIAVVIATLQLKDFLGLTVEKMPETYTDRLEALARALPTAHWEDLVVGAATLAVLLVWPRLGKLALRVPGPLVALSLAAVATFAASHFFHGFTVDTIGTRFTFAVDGVEGAGHGIPRLPPLPLLPWNLPGPTGEPVGLSFHLLRMLLPSAFVIAMLGAIESLLSATIADGMSETKHDPNGELIGQGIGNMVAPFFGGFAATGALARTATNVRNGARTPFAAIAHAVFVLLAVLVLAPLLAYMPMAALAALLLIVAWNMSEAKHFLRMLRTAPRSDVVVLVTCFALTVLFDMTISVTTGVLLAALLFMRRMSELAGARFVEGDHPVIGAVPAGVLVYEIAGPLFFGAAQKAMSQLHDLKAKVKVVVLDMASVPAMDATGMAALASALERLRRDKVFVVLAGTKTQPRDVLDRAEVKPNPETLVFAADVREGVELAKARLAEPAAA